MIVPLGAPRSSRLPASWEGLWEAFEIDRRSSISPRTLQNYEEALVDLARFLSPEPPDLEALTRRQMAAYLDDLGQRVASATAANRYRSLSAVFGWLSTAQDGEEPYLERNPLRGLKPPKIHEDPVNVLSVDDVRKLLATCKGGTFEDRRDEAIIRLLFDSGIRRGELVSMTVAPEALDLRGLTAVVSGKTGPRIVSFGPKTAAAIARYKRLRDKHAKRRETALWLGHEGHAPLLGNGVYQVLRRRFREAGLEPHKAAHVFRHSFAHHFSMAGGSTGDLTSLAGWTSPTMAYRYGRSAAAERARAAHARLSPGESL